MALSKAEQAMLDAMDNGVTMNEAVKLLPELTPEQLAQLDEYGDLIPSSSSAVPTTGEFSTALRLYP